MVNVLEMYELDLELSYRLISPATITKALKEQGLASGAVHEIIQLCEARKFKKAAKLAVNNGCNFEQLDEYLENNASDRKLYLARN